MNAIDWDDPDIQSGPSADLEPTPWEEKVRHMAPFLLADVVDMRDRDDPPDDEAIRETIRGKIFGAARATVVESAKEDNEDRPGTSSVEDYWTYEETLYGANVAALDLALASPMGDPVRMGAILADRMIPNWFVDLSARAPHFTPLRVVDTVDRLLEQKVDQVLLMPMERPLGPRSRRAFLARGREILAETRKSIEDEKITSWEDE